jgi:hypothetical protein
MGELER